MGGRRSEGSRLVYRVAGSPDAQRRGEVLLDLLACRLSIQAAGDRLGLGQARVNLLRQKIVQAVVLTLEPRPAGRPAKATDDRDRELQQLRTRVAELEHEVKVLELKTELNSVIRMTPGASASGKKTKQPRRERPRKTRSRRGRRRRKT